MKAWVEHAQSLLRNSLQSPQHELNELDWKVGLSVDKHRLAEHLCAFANYPGGGYLVYGIDTNANLNGVTLVDIERITNQLTNLGREAIEPATQLDHMGLHFQGIDILFICIPESAFKPVHRRGRPLDESYIRSGGTTRAASRQEIGSMMLHSKTPRWEDLHSSLLMSDEQMLEILQVDPIFELLAQPIITNPNERLDWMAGEGFVERHASGGGYITNLGAISAARRLTSFEAWVEKPPA
jgi:predicted HTH transcriptional regulator